MVALNGGTRVACQRHRDSEPEDDERGSLHNSTGKALLRAACANCQPVSSPLPRPAILDRTRSATTSFGRLRGAVDDSVVAFVGSRTPSR
jgi:hypothetical protein